MTYWPKELQFHDYGFGGADVMESIILRSFIRRQEEVEAKGYEWHPGREGVGLPDSSPQSLARARELREMNNQKSPLLRLGEPALIKILEMSLPNEAPLLRLHHLASVSHRFFQIVDRSPRLWARIVGAEQTRLVSKAIIKSDDHPLVVRFLDGTNTLLTLVLKEFSRWTAATIRIPEGFPTDAFHDVASRLRFLTLKSRHQSITMPNFLGNSRGALVHLALDRIIIPWDSPSISGLHCLSISNVQGTSSPSHRDILRMLVNCLELRRLKLSDVNMRVVTGGFANAPVRPPSLEAVYASDLTAIGANILLQNIDAPACKSFSLQWDHGRSRTTPAGVAGFVRTTLSNMDLNIERVELYCSRFAGLALMSYRHNDAGAEESSVVFNVGSSEGVGLLRQLDFMNLLPPNVANAPAKFFMAGDMHVQQPLLQSLSRFRSMTSLEFSDNYCVSTILDFLSTPQPTGWPFPLLDILSFEAPNVRCARALLGMVKARYGRSNAQQNASSLPAHFRRLHASNQCKKDRRYLNKIKAIVGSDVLDTSWADTGSDWTDSEEFWFDVEQTRGMPWRPPQDTIFGSTIGLAGPVLPPWEEETMFFTWTDFNSTVTQCRPLMLNWWPIPNTEPALRGPFTWTFYLEGHEPYQLNVGNGTPVPGSTWLGYSWTVDLPTGGPYQVSVTDANGATGGNAGFVTVLAETPPTSICTPVNVNSASLSFTTQGEEKQCSVIGFNVSGGVAPYTLTVIQKSVVSKVISYSHSTFSYVMDIEGGRNATFSITDAAGHGAVGTPFMVGSSSDTSCLTVASTLAPLSPALTSVYSEIAQPSIFAVESDGSHSRSNGGVIAAAVICTLLGLGIISAGSFFLWRSMKRRKRPVLDLDGGPVDSDSAPGPTFIAPYPVQDQAPPPMYSEATGSADSMSGLLPTILHYNTAESFEPNPTPVTAQPRSPYTFMALSYATPSPVLSKRTSHETLAQPPPHFTYTLPISTLPALPPGAAVPQKQAPLPLLPDTDGSPFPIQGSPPRSLPVIPPRSFPTYPEKVEAVLHPNRQSTHSWEIKSCILGILLAGFLVRGNSSGKAIKKKAYTMQASLAMRFTPISTSLPLLFFIASIVVAQASLPAWESATIGWTWVSTANSTMTQCWPLTFQWWQIPNSVPPLQEPLTFTFYLEGYEPFDVNAGPGNPVANTDGWLEFYWVVNLPVGGPYQIGVRDASGAVGWNGEELYVISEPESASGSSCDVADISPASLMINVSGSLTQCSEVDFNITGGIAPYTLTVIQAEGLPKTIHYGYSNWSSILDVPSGGNVSYVVMDSSGKGVVGPPFSVETSPNSTCLSSAPTMTPMSPALTSVYSDFALPAPTASIANGSKNPSNKSLSAAAAVAGSVGLLFLITVTVFLWFWLWQRRKRRVDLITPSDAGISHSIRSFSITPVPYYSGPPPMYSSRTDLTADGHEVEELPLTKRSAEHRSASPESSFAYSVVRTSSSSPDSTTPRRVPSTSDYESHHTSIRPLPAGAAPPFVTQMPHDTIGPLEAEETDETTTLLHSLMTAPNLIQTSELGEPWRELA